MVEFSRPIRLDELGPAPRTVSIEAGKDERAALATRFGLEAIHALAAEARIVRMGDSITASGRVAATVVQTCVATSEPVKEKVEEDFTLVFRPHPAISSPDEEIELGEGDLDVIFYDGGTIELGDAVAETVSLALNPFPRSASAEETLRSAGVKSEDEVKAEASPFAGLAGLRDKMGG
jgi:uncharacterized metal-binding protein YceD (DUF177 family)